MKKINVKSFEYERDFIEVYSKENPTGQINLLVDWRQHQININPKFISQIKLIANEQYSDLDHFILELLQNADDNKYSTNTPEVRIVLSEEKFELYNNEDGFTSDNLFAITYSAASTKTRDKTAATYIGEKGIGFKSVFSVAENVEIHSSPYHFRLDNNEFIIPHILDNGEDTKGTTIIVNFKDNKAIPNVLSKSLRSLVDNAQEFTLFLQKIERLEIVDNISNKKSTVQTIRDKENGFYIVRSEEKEIEYITKSYKKTIQNDVVKTRFNEIESDLDREIIFAVPIIDKKRSYSLPSGKIFCYLPTHIKLPIPIHIQIDAKTLTNRENIASFNESTWNKEIFSSFVDQMSDMYVALTKEEKIKEVLPEYLPFNIENEEIINADIKDLLITVTEELREKPIFLDRHEKFKLKDHLLILPKGLEIFAEDIYENEISRIYNNWRDNDNSYSFVSVNWTERYKDVLNYYELSEIDSRDIISLLKLGPPSKIDVNNNENVREFMALIIKTCNDYSLNKNDILDCPIFPILVGKERKWGKFDSETFWLQTDSPSKRVQNTSNIIDPEFTYSPGGGLSKKEGGEIIRGFNKRFREYLIETLEKKPYSIAEYYKKTVIHELQNIEIDVRKPFERKRVEELWSNLYSQIWNRKKTIIKEEDEIYWNNLTNLLSECKILVRIPKTNEWDLIQIKYSFLGPQFKTEHNLQEIYSKTNAPIIRFPSMQKILKTSKSKRNRKIDWEDWKNFLLECDAEEGGYFVNQKIEYGKEYGGSNAKEYEDKENIFAKEIMDSINSHWEYKNEGYNSFIIGHNSTTTNLDKYSLDLIGSESDDFLAKRISEIWKRLSNDRTVIYFIWGYKKGYRDIRINHLLVYEQIRKGLLLKSTMGYRNSTECFESSSITEKILKNIAPLVNIEANNYNRALLKKIGFNEIVDIEHLENMITQWFSLDSDHTTLEFIPYLKAIVEFCKEFPNRAHELRLKKIFFSQQENKLLSLLKWQENIDMMEYPESLIDDLTKTFNINSQQDYHDVLNIIFSHNKISEEIFEVIIDLSKYLFSENPDKIAFEFNSKLEAIGLTFNETKIYSVKELPIIWNRAPVITTDENIIVLNQRYWDNKELLNILDIIGWDTLTSFDIEVETDRKINLRNKEIKQTFFVLQEIIGPSKYDEHFQKLTKLKLFNSQEIIKERVLRCENILVLFEKNKKEIFRKVPYWFDGEKLFIKSSERLEAILPEFIDLLCNTTLRSTFRYVWNDGEILEKTNAEPQVKSVEKKLDTSKYFGMDQTVSDNYTNGSGNSKNNNATKERSSSESEHVPSGTRRNLFSYVQSKESEGSEGQGNSTSQTHNKIIEEAGVKKFKSILV